MKTLPFLHNYTTVLLILISTVLFGCAISNEGATDYRYIDPSSSAKKKFIKPNEINTKHIIMPGDALVISLKQIFINDFVEFRSPLRLIRGEPANAEIAIIVNAFEHGKGETTDFSPDGKKNARVVFFSDDVWEGQFLNLSNLSTIYGPLQYDGGAFVLDLYVVEMDTPGEQLKQLLSNLAAIGSTFYPPAAPIAGPLAQLAGTLISDDQDDRAYHHTVEFKPLGGDPELNTGILQTGNYVFIREENRHTMTNWNELAFDEKNGKVIYSHCKNANNNNNDDDEYSSDCYFRDNSYIVVEINTAASSIRNDAKQMIFKDLSTSVFSNSASIFKTPIPEQALDKLAKEVKKSRSADSIKSQLNILGNSSNNPVENKAGLDKFINLWTAKDENGKIKHQLNETDREYVEARLVNVISLCELEINKVIGMMNKLRNRETFTANNRDVITALSCLHK